MINFYILYVYDLYILMWFGVQSYIYLRPIVCTASGAECLWWHGMLQYTQQHTLDFETSRIKLCFFRRLKFSSWLFLQRLSFSPTLARVCRQVSHPDGSAVHTNEDDDLTIISPECCCSSPSGEVRWCTNTSKGWASLKMDCSEFEITKVRNKKTKKLLYLKQQLVLDWE